MNRPEPITPINRPQKGPALANARPRRHRQWLPIALAALSSALVLAACGGSSKPSSTSSSKPSSTSSSKPSKGSPPSYAKSQLAAAACIRKHGVPDFPDPTFGAGGAQVNLHAPLGMLTSPAFERAQKECAKLGLELAGYAAQSEKPSAADLARWLAVARCMRAHGVPNFPDPAKTMPPNPATYPARYTAVFNINGVLFAIPKSIDPQAPAVKRAAAACPGGDALIATG
jgi:hypothetical protein